MKPHVDTSWPWLMIGVSILGLCLSSCQSAYYQALETLGYHKRDILVNRVESARDVQQQAKEQFQSALEEFSVVLNFQGGELEALYHRLQAELDQSESEAEAVKSRIDAVEAVAEALFDEWEAELEQYTNKRLRRVSVQKLTQTRLQYEPLIRTMRRAEAKLDPVLAVFQDQVLFLKHNLNARAVASLQTELHAVEADIASLITQLEASIAEADAFINAMSQA